MADVDDATTGHVAGTTTPIDKACRGIGCSGGKVLVVATFIEPSAWGAALESLQQAQTILLVGAYRHWEDHLSDVVGQYAPGAGAADRYRRCRCRTIEPGTTDHDRPGPGYPTVSKPPGIASSGAVFCRALRRRSGHFLPVVIGTKRMVDRARRIEVDQVIVDTCGFISEDGGQALKRYQIDVVRPDVVVCLQRAYECEPILLGFSLPSAAPYSPPAGIACLPAPRSGRATVISGTVLANILCQAKDRHAVVG